MEFIGMIAALIGLFCFLIGLVLLSISGILLLLRKFNINALSKLHNHRLFKDIKKQSYLVIASFLVFVAGGMLLPGDEELSVESETVEIQELDYFEDEQDIDWRKEKEEKQKELLIRLAERKKVVAQAEKNNEEKIEKDRIEQEEQKVEEEQNEKEREEREEEQKAEEKKKLEEETRKNELAEANPNKSKQIQPTSSLPEVPSGKTYVVVNNNVPFFSNEDISNTDDYHKNGSFDNLNRVTAANALVGVDIMPSEERGSIGHIEPSGWNQASYAGIGSGGWLYNRSHLIGHQMTGNDDSENLMTGTRSFNMAMLEFENFVANYVETTENHVRYRVTPVFEGNNLVASGVYMEGFSIEDNGEAIMFNIFVTNRQPNIEINYANGSSVGPAGPAEEGEIPKRKSSQKSETPKTETPKTETPKSNPTPPPTPAPAENWQAVDTNGNGKVTIQEAKDAGFSMPLYDTHWLYKYMDDRNNNGMVGE